MKITVYNGKGGVGKTPISLNLALEHDWGIATNDSFSTLSLVQGLNEDNLMEITPGEEFPEFSEDTKIVFDLGGSITGAESSIISAIKQSKWVIVPVCNDTRSIGGAIMTLNDISPICDRVLLVATKLTRNRHEKASLPLEETKSFKEIRGYIDDEGYSSIPMLPLRYSTAFEEVFEKGESIRQLVERHQGIVKFNYGDLADQFDSIYKFISE